jgi:hypothetical protein
VVPSYVSREVGCFDQGSPLEGWRKSCSQPRGPWGMEGTAWRIVAIVAANIDAANIVAANIDAANIAANIVANIVENIVANIVVNTVVNTVVANSVVGNTVVEMTDTIPRIVRSQDIPNTVVARAAVSAPAARDNFAVAVAKDPVARDVCTRVVVGQDSPDVHSHSAAPVVGLADVMQTGDG